MKFLFQSKLNANRYATKKTIAQGMLDIALLASNASQLKYVLTVSKLIVPTKPRIVNLSCEIFR